jgi:acetylornithine deacetylase/succinyl-diaminopimelate desuccinylase-like protein
MSINQYISANKDRFLSELLDLLRIPSISANPAHKADMLKTADFVAESLKKAGADQVEICQTAGNPIVYGEKLSQPF